MSKVEKFIDNCTRTCSNEIAHWCEEDISIYSPWLTPDQARKAVEIEEEERIEKVYAAFCKTCKFNCNCNQESIIISITLNKQ